MNYALEQRLRMIDFLLAHYGAVGRAELEDYFGIGGATVTRDFQLYNQLAPGNMVLNNVSKRWVRSDTFKRMYE
jgi:predicted DNA-binding transcriptional regulator YafY